MEQDDISRSEDRVRMLAEAVGLPLDENRVAGVAEAFDAALALLDDLAPLAAADTAPVNEPYDPAWSPKGARS